MQLGAFQVVLQWQQLVIVPIFGVSEATGIFIGHAAGAKKAEELKPIFWATVNIVSLVSILVAGFYLFFHRYLASFYIDINAVANAKMLHLIELLFALSIFSRFFDNLKIVISGALRGLHDTKFSMWSSVIFAFVVSVPVGYLLAFKMNFGVSGFVVANAITLATVTVMLYYRWLKQKALCVGPNA